MGDAGVRPARPEDVGEIARIQLDTWRTAYARLLPAEVLEGITREQAEARWAEAVARPPSPRHHVLVATEQQWTVGFVAFGPADPDDAEGAFAQDGSAADGRAGSVLTLLVEPRWGRRGHGSRLLAATVDHLRADGLGRAVTWVLDRDTASTSFYESAGWERDGYARTLQAPGGAEIREVRLRVLLGDG
jgi:GNAT superfamily N-acetyltransferase